MLELDAYIHITSPIRRLVDLLNMIQFQQNTSMIHLSAQAQTFYDKWMQDLDYINASMRSIRKVQTDCNLLHLCSTQPSIMETLNQLREGIGLAFDASITPFARQVWK